MKIIAMMPARLPLSHLAASTPVTVDADADDHNGQQQIKAAGKSKTSCTERDHRVEKENDQDENGPSNQPHIWPF